MLLWFDPRKQEQLKAGHVFFIQAGGVKNRNDCKIKEKKLNKTFDEYDDVIPFIIFASSRPCFRVLGYFFTDGVEVLL